VAYRREPAAIAVRRDIYVGASSAEAQEVKAGAVARGYRGIDPSALVAGSAHEVAEQFRAFAGLGFTDVIVRHLTNDQPNVLASLARLAEVRDALKSV
jgi:hypothetical protein